MPTGLQSLIITLSNVITQYHINSFDTAQLRHLLTISRSSCRFICRLWSSVRRRLPSSANIGAQKLERAQKGTKVCLMPGVGLTVCTSVVMLLVGRWAFWVFNHDIDVIENGMKITFPFYWIYNILEIYGASIRGAGKANPPLIIILSNICVLRTILLFIIMYFWHDLRGITITYPVTWITTAACMSLYYHRGDWQKRGKNKDPLHGRKPHVVSAGSNPFHNK